jgi:YVTN family beta-propeller protein
MKSALSLLCLSLTLPLAATAKALEQTALEQTATEPTTASAPQKAALCFGCHGRDGLGLGQEYPNLAGQSQWYLQKQLLAFRSGERQDPTMKVMAATLTDTDITELSHWFAGLGPCADHQIAEPASKPSAPSSMTAIRQYFSEHVFATMKAGATIHDLPTNTVWAGGPDMLYNALSPDEKLLLATSPSTNTVYIFDAQTGQQRAIVNVGKAPKGVKITPDGKLAYVSNEGGASVSVIDLGTHQVIDTIKVEEAPHNVRFNRSGTLAYVTLQGGAGIGVINTSSRKQTRIIPVPGITGPHNIDLSADEKIAYVRDFVHHVAVLDLVEEKVLTVITVGNGHGGIDVSPDGSVIATAAIGDNIISIIDPVTWKSTDVIVGDGPHGIRTSANSRWIYVTLTKENRIAIVDAKTRQLVSKIDVGQFPFWLALPGNI